MYIYVSLCLFQTPVQQLTLRLTRFYTTTPCQRVWARLQQVMKKFSYDVRTSPDKVRATLLLGGPGNDVLLGLLSLSLFIHECSKLSRYMYMFALHVRLH